MKITDIPINKTLRKELSNKIVFDDDAVALWQSSYKIKATTIMGRIIGACVITKDATDENADRQLIPIMLNDVWFATQHKPEESSLPLAVLMYFQGVDQAHIVINAKTREYYFNDITRDICSGVIAHEVGHYLAGHRDRFVIHLSLPPTAIAHTAYKLLTGDPCTHVFELEANIYAIALVGLAPVLAFMTIHASRSYALGVRLSFSNQIHQLIDMVYDGLTLPPLPYKDLIIELFNDEDITSQTGDINHDPVRHQT